jgi:hypothetical protein
LGHDDLVIMVAVLRKGTRLRRSNGKIVKTDRPFTEAEEVPADEGVSD